MATTREDDDQSYFILGLAAGIIALIILLVIGVALRATTAKAERQPPSPTTVSMVSTAPVPGSPDQAVVTQTTAVVIPEGASIRVDGDVVNFYFAYASADIAPGAAEALAKVIQGVGAGKKAQVSGFHDTSGDPALNAELAKRRAETVRDVLVGLGAPVGQVQLKKPEVTTGNGNAAQARRVEVRLVD
ncbi:MAG: OmpA family protein [Proteobacteria bacterium]|nr:OmpA family protein [Pseudomonadota bacterium]